MLENLLQIYLLFISYKFVKGFFAITFLLFVICSRNFHEVCQPFYITFVPGTKFQLDPTKNEKFPHRPHYKNRPLL